MRIEQLKEMIEIVFEADPVVRKANGEPTGGPRAELDVSLGCWGATVRASRLGSSTVAALVRAGYRIDVEDLGAGAASCAIEPPREREEG